MLFNYLVQSAKLWVSDILNACLNLIFTSIFLSFRLVRTQPVHTATTYDIQNRVCSDFFSLARFWTGDTTVQHV